MASRSRWLLAMRVATVMCALGALVTAPLGHVAGLHTASAYATGDAPDEFNKTVTVTRDHLLPDGSDSVVDSRDVTVSVDVTSQLRTLQQVNVTWSGARPTNFVYSDPNSASAGGYEEYPMVLLECRGVDDSAAPAVQQLQPRSCWTLANEERNARSGDSAFPAWRLDRYADPGLGAYDNIPAPLPDKCLGGDTSDTAFADTFGAADYYLPLDGANGKTYYSGPTAACSVLAPEQSNFSSDFPDNTTFGVTAPDGTGRAKFVVWTGETNATLGCSQTVPCSLVAIPIMGVSCDETATPGVTDRDVSSCTYADERSGSPARPGGEEPSADTCQCLPSLALQSITGDLWWTPSNWRNRISVPLTFAPPSNYCSVVGTKSPVFVYGSELMTEAAQQWMPTFCTDADRTPFVHVPQAEPAAANEVSFGGAEAAFDTYPPSGSAGAPLVNAPVAVTGFAIATEVDDAKGHVVTDLRLNARLLAKLLSESYPDQSEIAVGDGSPDHGTSPGPMANNPLNITLDPEFIALNPGIRQVLDPAGSYDADVRSSLIALSSNSDVMYALTSYLNADPAARAFLDGHPDPWGMVVNPNYWGISLPTDSWPLLDTFEPMNFFAHDVCFSQKANQTPYLPLVASPLLALQGIAYNMEFSLPTSATYCNVNTTVTAASKLTAVPREQPGLRFLLGVVSLGDAARYDLDVAQLESRTTLKPSQKFTDASNDTFAVPTAAALQTAAQSIAPDPTSGAWRLDYDRLRTDPALASGYPGTMLVSMTVPTGGLAAGDAQAYADLLRFAAGPGQTPGSGFGQLPRGYLPMTPANGLGTLVDFTTRAADAVEMQQCGLPTLTDPASTSTSSSVCAPTGDASATPVETPSSVPDTIAPVASTGPRDVRSDGGAAAPPPLPVASAGPIGSTGGALQPPAAAPAAPTSSARPPLVAAGSPPTVLVSAVTPVVPVGAVGNLVPLLLLGAAVCGALGLGWHSIAQRRAASSAAAER